MGKFNDHQAPVKKDPPGSGSTALGKLSSKRLLFLSFALLSIVLVGSIYSNVIDAPFVFDDMPNIKNNLHIRMSRITLDELADAGFRSVAFRRPVANISFALNYVLHGLDTTGYHVVNIVVHLLAGMFLFLLIRDTVTISRKTQHSPFVTDTIDPSWLAFAVALVWLVHPLQTQSVTYIVQRMNSMAAMFYMMSMWLYVQARLSGTGLKWYLYAGCILSGLLAVGTKEIAVTLPVFIFIYEWYFFQDLHRSWVKKGILPIAALSAALVLLSVLFLGFDPIQKIMGSYVFREFTPVQRLLTELRAVMLYIGLIFLPAPWRLNLDYDFPLSYSLFNPVTTAASLVFLAGILVLAVIFARKERLISFCILWFLGNLVIESSVIGLELVYEHRTYLPSMFFVLLVFLLAARFITRTWMRVGIVCVIVAVFSLWTFQRNGVWADEGSFLQDIVMKSPADARAHYNLGKYLYEQRDYDAALEEFTTALDLARDHREMIYVGIGNAYARKGMYREAVGYYTSALKTTTYSMEYNQARIDLGFALEKMGRVSEAMASYREAIERNPNADAAYSNLGRIMARSGMVEEGKRYISKALQINPHSVDANCSMAKILIREGRFQEAVESCNRALAIKPDYAYGHFYLASAWAELGGEHKAMRHYRRALELAPDFLDAHKNLGALYLKRGELEKARGEFEQVLRIKPDDPGTRQMLTAAVGHMERIESSRARVEKEIERDPSNPTLHYQLGDLYRMKGRFDDALASYHKALSLLPRFPQALQQIAVIHVLKGDNETAASYLRKIVEIRPDDPNSYYNLACIYAKMNRVDESVQWLSLAIEKGFADWELLRGDRDLNNIRNTPYFKGLMGSQG